MRVCVFFIAVYSVCVQSESTKDICLKYFEDNTSDRCEIQGASLAEEQFTNLQGNCQSYRNANLYWITFLKSQINGLGHFDISCRNISFKQLTWIPWNENKKFLNNTITQSVPFLISNTTSGICALNVRDGDCQNLRNASEIVRENIQILAERIPTQYVLQNITYINSSLSESKEVVVADKILQNHSPIAQVINATLEYNLTHLYKPDLDSLLISTGVPIKFYVQGNQLAQNTSDGWIIQKYENASITRTMNPNDVVNASIVVNRTTESYGIRIDFIRVFEDNSVVVDNVPLLSIEIIDQQPGERDQKVIPDNPNNKHSNAWIILAAPLTLILAFGLTAFVLVKMKQNDVDWCCLCQCCGNCWKHCFRKSHYNEYTDINNDSGSSCCST